MSALLPSGCRELGPLTRLDLNCCQLRGEAQVCLQLGSVLALRLCNCFTCDDDSDDDDSDASDGSDGSDGDDDPQYAAVPDNRAVFHAALHALLQQVPALTHLSLEECLGGHVGGCILDAADLPLGLTSLCLRTNDLSVIPEGPYPPGEAIASQRACVWASLHSASTEAVSGTAPCAARVLPPQTPQPLFATTLCCAGLADLDLGGNDFTRLPPQVMDCTGLTRLVLDANEELVRCAGLPPTPTPACLPWQLREVRLI